MTKDQEKKADKAKEAEDDADLDADGDDEEDGNRFSQDLILYKFFLLRGDKIRHPTVV